MKAGRIICLIASLSLIMFIFSACGEKSTKEKVQDAAEEFVDDLFD